MHPGKLFLIGRIERRAEGQRNAGIMPLFDIGFQLMGGVDRIGQIQIVPEADRITRHPPRLFRRQYLSLRCRHFPARQAPGPEPHSQNQQTGQQYPFAIHAASSYADDS